MKIKHYPENPKYLVSDLGQIFGPAGGAARPDSAPIYSLITPSINDAGYLRVTVYASGVPHSEFVHRMVLETFYGPPRDGQQASHLNGVPTDCRLENLVWESAQQNNSRKFDHGTAYNSAIVTRRIREHDIETIFACYDDGMSYTDIAKRYGVNRTTIARLIMGKRNPLATALIRAKRAEKGQP